MLFGVLQFLESPPGVPTASGLGWAGRVGIRGGAGCSPGPPYWRLAAHRVRANRSQPQPRKSRMAPPTTWTSPEAAAVLLPWSPALLSGWQGLDAVGEPTLPWVPPLTMIRTPLVPALRGKGPWRERVSALGLRLRPAGRGAGLGSEPSGRDTGRDEVEIRQVRRGSALCSPK